MDGRTLFTELKSILTDLYLEPNNAKRIAADAGLDLTQIPFDAKAINNWHNILAESIKADTLDALLDKALEEYPQNQCLINLCETYRRFIESDDSFDSLFSIAEQIPARIHIDISGDISGVVAGRDVIHSIINTGDHNQFFIGHYERLQDAYIKPWEVFDRTNQLPFNRRPQRWRSYVHAFCRLITCLRG